MIIPFIIQFGYKVELNQVSKNDNNQFKTQDKNYY